ncbi:MAG: single-stranded DNA-binding protein [Verrucomicrobia bacterium]|nr:single-stranded DNA-binding protein [Verrucomicrobiota bacterium]
MNNVQLLGKITLEPKIKEVKKGTKLAEIGIGISESYRKESGEWENRMHFVDVVVWGKQAELVEKSFKKGDGILVEGSLQFDSWEKDGQRRSRLRVKGQRIQPVQLPQYNQEYKKAS